MAERAPVVIEPEGARYRVLRQGDVLFTLPGAVLDAYEPDAVFPPLWPPADDEPQPARRLLWQPRTRELLMAGADAHPARLVEALGASPYRAYLQALWTADPSTLYLRPFWNPGDPYDPFDLAARRLSFEVQRSFLDLLGSLLPPEGWSAVLNAVEPLLDAALSGAPDDDTRELSLTPPARLDDPRVRHALEVLAVEQVGECAPVLRDGALLTGALALSLRALHAAEAALDGTGLLHQPGPYLPH